MQASMWLMLLYVFLAGAVGGIINALMTDNGFSMPKREKADGKTTILRPGYLGNVVVGAVGAVVSWGLYGPLGSVLIAGTHEAIGANDSGKIGLTLSSLVGAVMIGVAGARWLTNEVDKDMLKAAASQAASSPASAHKAQRIATASSPAQALKIARE